MLIAGAPGKAALSPLPFALLAVSATVMAEMALACAGRIASPPEISAEYNPFNPIDRTVGFRVAIENTGTEACRYGLMFRSQPGEAGFEHRLRTASGAELRGSGPAADAPARALTRALAPGESEQVDLTLEIPAGQMLAPGRHAIGGALVLTGGPETRPDASGASELHGVPVTLVSAVDDRLGVNIAGAGQSITVDFGDLVQGESRQVAIVARANRNFHLEIESAAGGVMAMAPPYEGWRIDYTVTLDGRSLKLPYKAGPFSQAGLSGRSFSLEFRIGDTNGKRAGLYSDEITVTIRPAI